MREPSTAVTLWGGNKGGTGAMTPANLEQALGPQVRLAAGGGADHVEETLKDLRLAYNPGPVNQYKALDPPTVRLASCAEMVSGSYNGGANHIPFHKEAPPSMRLAHTPGAQGDNCLKGERGVEQLPQTHLPALLVSFVYLPAFLKNRHRYAYRDWVLDSGAFSAHMSGKVISLDKYIETCKELLTTDPTLTEVFSLDVIGNWQDSIKNTEKMWEAGVPAIPCFHVNEPEHMLKHMATHYPKVALGGVALQKGQRKLEWAQQCFARIWPKKIHGFGYGGEGAIMALPWHSVDATNWELGPCKFGRWQSFGQMSVRGSKQNLRAEVEWFLRLEQRARSKWKKEMMLLETLDGPTCRLAHSSQWRPWRDGKMGLEKQDDTPVVRLSVGGTDRSNSDDSTKAKSLAAPAVRLAAQQSSDAQIKRSGLESPEIT